MKFRVHDGPSPGKYSFNANNGTPLKLNAQFRPAAEGETACYSVEVTEGRTAVTMLDRGATWNGKPTQDSPFEVRAGHLLASSSVTVEILECPDSSGSKTREETQFLDLSCFSPSSAAAPKKAAVPPPVRADLVGLIPKEPAIQGFRDQLFAASAAQEPAIKEEVFAEPEVAVSAPVVAAKEAPKAPLVKEQVYVEEVPAPEPYDCDPATSEIHRPTFTPRPGAVLEDPNVIQLRRRTLKNAGITAAVFAVLIFGANQLAKQHYYEFEEPDVSLPIVKYAIRPMTEREIIEVRTSRAQEQAPAPVDTAAAKELMSAIEEGDLAVVQKLIDTGGQSPEKTLDDLGRTPFVRAAAAGRVSVLQYLLTKNVYRDSVDFKGNNALMWSVINGHEKTVAFLLKSGMNAAIKREDGKTALLLARQQRLKPIEQLLSGPQRSTASVPAKQKK